MDVGFSPVVVTTPTQNATNKMPRINIVRRLLIPLSVLLATLVGCSRGPTPIRPPDVDPQSAADAAMETYDSNSDGSLDEGELAACPGLLEGLAKYDKDDDGKIQSEEIEKRLANLYDSGVGILNLGCRVMARGKPIPGCTVRLIPEGFLGDALKPAEGKTRESGTAMLRIAPGDLPQGLENVRGVQSGVYRAEVSHPSSSVTKKIEKAGPFGFDVSVDDQVTGLTIDIGR